MRALRGPEDSGVGLPVACGAVHPRPARGQRYAYLVEGLAGRHHRVVGARRWNAGVTGALRGSATGAHAHTHTHTHMHTHR